MSGKIPLIGTSWKMNKTRGEALAFAAELKASPFASSKKVQSFVVPPFPYIADVAGALAGTKVKVGAQNMHWETHGAWTGEVSPVMLKDCGARFVELGHSERRMHFGETDETVALKVLAALRNGLTALVCIGDTRAEFEVGQTAQALERQARAMLKYVGVGAIGKVWIAYEPVWSIGEGGVPATPEFANAQHVKIDALVQNLIGAKLPILYGGSVHQDNCVALIKQSHIEGLFIGRAAWAASGYISILKKVTEALS